MPTDDAPAPAATHLLGGDLPVPRMGFGAMHLPTADPGTALNVARRAVELGVRHIDTAAFYRSGDRGANEILREALSPYPADLTIATKVGPMFPGGGRAMVSAGPGRLRRLVEENLEQLGVDRLDLVYLRVGGPESLAERFTVLDELRGEGLIRHLGISSVILGQLAEARSVAPVAAVQNRYGVLEQDDAAMVEACAAAGIAYTPYFALGGGRTALSGDALDAVAVRHGATGPQVALAWGLHRSPTVVQIPGTGSVAHLRENVLARDLVLSAQDMAELTRR